MQVQFATFCCNRFERLCTPTNLLLASLAGADFSVGLMGPFFFYLVGVPSGIRLSQSVRSVCLFSLCGALLSTLCSVFSLLAIAVDRFLAITMPLRYDDIMTFRKAKMAIAVIWSVAFTMTIPPSLGHHRWSSDSRCSLTEVLHMEYVLALFAMPVVICLSVLTVLYYIVFVIAWKQRRQIQASSHSCNAKA